MGLQNVLLYQQQSQNQALSFHGGKGQRSATQPNPDKAQTQSAQPNPPQPAKGCPHGGQKGENVCVFQCTQAQGFQAVTISDSQLGTERRAHAQGEANRHPLASQFAPISAGHDPETYLWHVPFSLRCQGNTQAQATQKGKDVRYTVSQETEVGDGASSHASYHPALEAGSLTAGTAKRQAGRHDLRFA